MKNITLSAPDATIDALRRLARAQDKTVNELFRAWADDLAAAAREKRLRDFEKSIAQTRYVRLDRKYTRDEMNQRRPLR